MTETIEDLLEELRTAALTGHCPYCSAIVVPFEDQFGEGLQCPVCGWFFCLPVEVRDVDA